MALKQPEIFVDGDACPVKDEILRVAERHGLSVHLISNQWHRQANRPGVNQVVVAEGPDVADDWIAEHIGAGDIAVTQDIPLAARCLEKDASALGPTGRPFTKDNIGMALAMRELNAELRDRGEIKGTIPAFTKKSRSEFLSALEGAIQKAKRRA